jgi:hypothetical protein
MYKPSRYHIIGCILCVSAFISLSVYFNMHSSGKDYASHLRNIQHNHSFLDFYESSYTLDTHRKYKHHMAQAAFHQMLTPVFIVYHNTNNHALVKNFICNMEIFPPTNQHILLVVANDAVAADIHSFNNQINVLVAPHSHHHQLHHGEIEMVDYHTLTVARGFLAIELLRAAVGQNKTLTWLDPNFHYMQNLLRRREVKGTSITVYQEEGLYLWSFLHLPPTPDSMTLYSNIMHRALTLKEEEQMKHGTLKQYNLLKSVLHDMELTPAVFDECCFASSTRISSCKGVRPVAVMQDRKSKHRKHFVDFSNSDVCKQRDLSVVVMTMNRFWSLKRLLRSLSKARYLPGNTIDLRITVDRDFNNNVDRNVMRLLDSFQWKFGILDIHVWPTKMGIYGNWVHCWPAEQYPEKMYKAVVLLEDDLEVSPHYATWFVGAHLAYGNLSGVGAITGQRPELVAALDGPPSVKSQVPPHVKAFGYMQIATWSTSPTHSAWKGFREWVINKRAKEPDFSPWVEGIVPNVWYNNQKHDGEEESMWEMWYIRYMDDMKLHTVYPWIQNGDETMVGNWKEPGLHFSGFNWLDFPITTEWDGRLLTQNPLPLVGYDLDFKKT